MDFYFPFLCIMLIAKQTCDAAAKLNADAELEIMCPDFELKC